MKMQRREVLGVLTAAAGSALLPGTFASAQPEPSAAGQPTAAATPLPKERVTGIGGIFFDYLNSAGDAGNSAFDADFAFVRDVGETFLAVYSDIVRSNAEKPWAAADREATKIRKHPLHPRSID